MKTKPSLAELCRVGHVAAGAAVLAALVTAACGPRVSERPAHTFFAKAPAPVVHQPLRSEVEPTDWWDEGLHSTVLPLTRLASPRYFIGRLLGGESALDINDFGQVLDSSWFENRINRGLVSTTQIENGLALKDTEGAFNGPAGANAPAHGDLTIISGKVQGVTPGFVVRDSRGQVWFVKFDPPAYPRMTTAAEMVGSRLLGAAGYHVAHNVLRDLDMSRLVLDPSAKTRDKYNRKVSLTDNRLEVLLAQLNPGHDGTVRALFSRAVHGMPIGPFRFRGRRGTDPNDTIVHERRRSLRGLWLFSAWIGNTDTRQQNTLDTFIASDRTGNLGFIKHYLLDFGDALGSAGIREKHTAQGYELGTDWHEIGLRLITLGFRDPLWFRVKRSPFREVGVFEWRVFDPATWSPRYNNQAFLAADADDTFWAASILAHFTRADVAAAVAAAEFKNPQAAEWVVETLWRRRAKLLRYAFAELSTLDIPRVVGTELRLTDLNVLAELAGSPPRYHFAVSWKGERELTQVTVDVPHLELAEQIAKVRAIKGFAADPVLTVVARALMGKERGPSVTVQLVYRQGQLYPATLSRP